MLIHDFSSRCHPCAHDHHLYGGQHVMVAVDGRVSAGEHDVRLFVRYVRNPAALVCETSHRPISQTCAAHPSARPPTPTSGRTRSPPHRSVIADHAEDGSVRTGSPPSSSSSPPFNAHRRTVVMLVVGAGFVLWLRRLIAAGKASIERRRRSLISSSILAAHP